MPAPRISLALICADFSLHRLQELPSTSLEHLVAFSDGISATRSHSDLEPWQSELLQALRLNDGEINSSAPLTWRGANAALEPGTWMHADPVRFEISATGLAFRAMPRTAALKLRTIEREMQQQVTAARM